LRPLLKANVQQFVQECEVEGEVDFKRFSHILAE
jgi:hypothetical protein